MGLVCASCDRKNDLNEENKDESYNSWVNSPNKREKTKKLFMIYDKKRDDDETNIPNAFKTENRLALVINSASNYWSNRDKMTLFGSHRAISKYKTKALSRLIRVGNSIITLEEYLAAKRIERCYLKYKRKLMTANSSPSNFEPIKGCQGDNISCELNYPKDFITNITEKCIETTEGEELAPRTKK